MNFREFAQLVDMQTPFNQLPPGDQARMLRAMTADLMQEIEALSGPSIPQGLKDKFEFAIKRSMTRR